MIKAVALAAVVSLAASAASAADLCGWIRASQEDAPSGFINLRSAPDKLKGVYGVKDPIPGATCTTRDPEQGVSTIQCFWMVGPLSPKAFDSSFHADQKAFAEMYGARVKEVADCLPGYQTHEFRSAYDFGVVFQRTGTPGVRIRVMQNALSIGLAVPAPKPH